MFGNPFPRISNEQLLCLIQNFSDYMKNSTHEVYRSQGAYFQWLISGFMAVLSVLVRSDPGYVHYCTVYVSHPRTAVFSLCVMSLLEAAALVYFIILLQSNQRRQVNEFVNNAMHTLTERYQLQSLAELMGVPRRLLVTPPIAYHGLALGSRAFLRDYIGENAWESKG
ncbi:hypothetical protein ANCCAN_22603 [Ancylostoma caninum]|uniref:Uncharacterized protein n=1 Tax=Ancylostoma caninum TaxID=29170 RepID=A0A368FHJ3_ANCCA|nr:hypothetical protein ANCCAN_22603 [Ancylostoma caninum]